MSTLSFAANKVAVIAIVAGIAVLGLGWVYFGSDNTLTTMQHNVAQDAEAQYKIVKAGGSKIEICAHAGVVKMMYLQTQDQDKYIEWGNIERADCADAGVVR